MIDNAAPSGVEVRPLSHRQKMIWAGQMLDRDVPLYNMAHAFTIQPLCQITGYVTGTIIG